MSLSAPGFTDLRSFPFSLLLRLGSPGPIQRFRRLIFSAWQDSVIGKVFEERAFLLVRLEFG